MERLQREPDVTKVAIAILQSLLAGRTFAELAGGALDTENSC